MTTTAVPSACAAPAPKRPRFSVHAFVEEFHGSVVSRPGRWMAWMKITPEMADAWLTRFNTKNRTLRQHRVDRYASDVRTGNWKETGQPIVLDEDGILLTGQHTLHAVIAAGVPIVTLVVVGVDRECRYFVDLGLAKVLADFLMEDDVPCSNNVAAALSFKARYDARCMLVSTTAVTLTNEHKRAVLSEHPGIVSAVMETPRPAAGFGGRGLWAWLGYEFGQRDDALAREFLTQVLLGVRVEENTPACALRRRLEKQRTVRGSGLPTPYIVAIAIKAWNATRRGRSMEQIGWRTGEPFPEIE